MKKQQKQDMGSKNMVELRKLLSEARQALFTLRIDHGQRKLKNTSSLAHKRKEIAQIQTKLKEMEFKNENV